MTELRFVGLSDDGSALVMSGDGDGTFTLPLDDTIATAVRRDRQRPARLETEMEGALRPRDIQARIRAGASVDDVVAESGISHERVERFAGPMLAEREHVATLARGTEMRRDFAPDLELEAAVAERLEPLGVESGSVSWDAWRREDGRWLVEAAYTIGREQRSGHWSFDPKSASLAADDDEGRWLIDPQAPEPAGTDRGKPRLASVRTLTTVAEQAPEAVIEAIEDAIDEALDEAFDDAGATALEDGEVEVYEIDIDLDQIDVEIDVVEEIDAVEDIEAADDFTDDSAAALTVLDAQSHADVAEIADEVEEQLTLVDHPDDSATGTDDAAADSARPASKPAAARHAPKRKGRAAVPTWDDIVFGSRKSTD